MLKRLFLTFVSCALAALTWADEPFRNHRYDSFQATPVTDQSIVFVGNSITNMQPWAELFAVPGVVNRGNSGGFSWEILANIQSYIARRPAKLFLMIGTNDMNVAGYSPEAVVKNVRQTVKHIRKESPRTEIYMQSVMPSTNGSRTVAKGQTLNAQLKAMAQEVGVTYVDYFDALMGCTDGTMSYDNLHPHVAGTYAWTKAVAPYVGGEAVLPESPAIQNGGQTNSYGARASVLAQLPVTSDDVLFLGDEFVHSGEWQELLGNPHVKNRGTGWGKWGPDITFQTTCVPLFLQGLSANAAPKQVLLMIGSQNLTSSSSNKEAFKTKYEACIKAIRDIAPSTHITLVSQVPYGPTATAINVNNLVPINQWLREKAAATDNMDYCDLYSVLADANNVAIGKYLNADQYVTGLGYQACARELAKHIDGCTVMSEAEAEAYYSLIAARKVLSNAIDAAELAGADVDLEPYYSLLAKDATVAELEEGSASLSGALHPDVPFQPTALADGQFTGAQWWYTMKLKGMWYLYDNGSADRMALDRMKADGQDDEWCFTGNPQKGYTIYNRKYGTAKVLASPKAMTGSQGSTAYVKLVDAANVPSGYETKWMFQRSADIDGGYYMMQLGREANAVNNNANLGYLSFWTGGKDAGSTLLIELSEATIPMEKADGYFTRDGNTVTSGWCQKWISHSTSPFQITFGTSYNNMNAATMGIAVGSSSAPWVFAVSDQDYYVHGYSFEIKGGNANQTITPNGGTAVQLKTGTYTAIQWEGNGKPEQAASFTYAGANAESAIRNMQVVVRKRTVAVEPQFNVFEYGSAGNNVCYRIPAIATAQNGDVIAVADYRYGGADIGFGRVSLRYRVSKDNGATWGDILTLQESVQGSYGVNAADNLWAGFGDPCIVADRESGEVLVQSCCGNVSYPAGTWAHHQGIAQFRSYDNGATWEEYPDRSQSGITCRWKDIAPDIYQKFRAAGVDVAAMFIGSGRIFQSRFTKVGKYYRLYCVVLLRTPSAGGLNYVLYSDDFGREWKLLGGSNVTNAINSGDEPKAEELPDGSVLVSSRAQGRLFNIFHFTDVAQGEGEWMSQAQSMNSNHGICEQGGNPTNGEIYLLPVVRRADNKKMWMALQSVPFGNGRANVGIYYKALENYAGYNTPANFAKDWDGRHQSSFMGSAYSTITLQHDNHIGFLYEEETFGRAYTIVYKKYSIEQITDSLYTLDADAPVDPYVLTSDGIEQLTEGLTFSNYMGGLKAEAREKVDAAIATFKAEPCQENYIAIYQAIASAPRNQLDVTKLYLIRNTSRGGAGAYAMCVSSASERKLKTKTYRASDRMQLWAIEPSGTEGYYYLYNVGTKTYVMNLLARETAMYTTADRAQAGLYRLQQISGDRYAMVNLQPADASIPAIHAPGDYTERMVAWTPSSEASQWFFEVTANNSGIVDAIDFLPLPSLPSDTAYDLQGRAVPDPQHGLFIVNRQKIIVK